MTISTKLFSDQMLNRFSQINEAVQLRQTKISTGQNITEAAEKPMEAVKLSAMEERLTQLGGFERNVGTAQDRLALGDGALAEVDNILVRLREQSIKAINSTVTPSGLAAIRVEVGQLRESLISLANTQANDGQALFGGYATDIVPFQIGADGSVAYHGDGGEHTLAASETMRLPTSVNGGEVFMQVQTDAGRQSIFDIVDSFEAALMTASDTQDTLSGGIGETLSLRFNGDRTPRDWSFVLSGPSSPLDGNSNPIGVQITASDVVDGSHEHLMEAINARSAETGVTASQVDGRLELNVSSGRVNMSDLKVEGVSTAMREPRFTVTSGDDPVKTLVPEKQTLSAQLDMIVSAGEDIAISRTKVGARLARAENQEDVLATRSLAMQVEVNEMSSVDLEKVITELQTLLITQNASRQVYTQISQTSLFDYLK